MNKPSRSYENLKTIHFEGELLPKWTQLLDLASRMCPGSDATRRWFSTFTQRSGVDDARTVLTHCELLRGELRAHQGAVLSALRRDADDSQVTHIYEAWIYALDTMIQQASSKPTCTWHVDGSEVSDDDALGGGEINLRRV